MPNTIEIKAARFALQAAKSDYDAGTHPTDVLTDVIAYLTTKVRAQTPPRPKYQQLAMFAIPGRLTGKLKCKRCGQMFGDTNISPKVNWRMYLILPCCPYCGYHSYTNTA